LLGIASREGDLPEVFRGFGELDSHCPFAVLQGAHIYDPAFSLLACAPIYEQNPLVFLDPGGQRERSSVSVHREHVGELVEGIPEHVLPKNMYPDGQAEPRASSELPARPNLGFHSMPNLNRQPSGNNSTDRLVVPAGGPPECL
jgi:hypothetical protein